MESYKIDRFEYIPSLDSALGAFLNGSWNGLVGMLHRGVSLQIEKNYWSYSNLSSEIIYYIDFNLWIVLTYTVTFSF